MCRGNGGDRNVTVAGGAGLLLAWACLPVGGCNGNSTGTDSGAETETDATDEWVRRFDYSAPCHRDFVPPSWKVDDWIYCRERETVCEADGPRQAGLHAAPYAGWCEVDDVRYLLYVNTPWQPGDPWVRIREVDDDGSAGEAREVDLSGVFGGEGLESLEAIQCRAGRFRMVARASGAWAGDPNVDADTRPMPIYLLEVDPGTAAVVGTPRYLNGIGRELRFASELTNFRFHGDRLFFMIHRFTSHLVTVGEVDLEWDGTWPTTTDYEDEYAWTRFFEQTTVEIDPRVPSWDEGFSEFKSITPLDGDRVLFSQETVWSVHAVSGALFVGRRTGAPGEYGVYDTVELIGDLMSREAYDDYENSRGIRVAVGQNTILAVHDEWALLFDRDLNRIGRPINFGTVSREWRQAEIVYGGGYYAIFQTGTAGPGPDGDYVLGAGADLAISIVSEEGEFIDRKSLYCPSDGLENTLGVGAHLMDAYWDGDGFWMVFYNNEGPHPEPYYLYYLFLPVP